MTRTALSAMVVVLLAVCSAVALGSDDAGWQRMFDGETLDGWQPSESPASWTVKDGALVGKGPRSHLYYMKQQVENFELKSDVMINPGGNSGIYFHIEYHDGGWFFDGHEVQVNNSHRDPVRTGSLWNVVRLYDTPVEDDTWFAMHVIVNGQNIVVKVNDKIVVDYTEPRGAEGPRRLGKGYLALQQHDPRSSASFRNLMLKILPPTEDTAN